MTRILSTKKLTASQSDKLVAAGMTIDSYNAIRIKHIPFDIPIGFDHLIFTSQNAVRSFLELDKSGSQYSCFCVGDKTSQLLRENGQKVKKIEKNASLLADFIAKNYKNGSFLFLSGNLSRMEIPQKLSKAGVQIQVLEVYRTELVPRFIEKAYNALLFFSPSGVESFMMENSIGDETLYCIGPTTAEAASAYSANIVIARETTVESVVESVIEKQNETAR